MGRESSVVGKWRPIIFGGETTAAILAGRKSQTRRPVQGLYGHVEAERLFGLPASWRFRTAVGGLPPRDVACPYGGVGDRLWVRESLRDDDGATVYDADGFPAVDGSGRAVTWGWGAPRLSATFMPRHLSRIALRIEDVRVQRLSLISPSDALAEGVEASSGREAVARFRSLWERIHGPSSWGEDPWVWALTFSRIKGGD